MGIDMLDKLASMLVIVVGAYLIIYHRRLGSGTAEFRRNRLLPLGKKATPKEYSIVYLASGIILSLVGVLTLFGVIHLKW
jgi:hypothetical protein